MDVPWAEVGWLVGRLVGNQFVHAITCIQLSLLPFSECQALHVLRSFCLSVLFKRTQQPNMHTGAERGREVDLVNL